MGIKEAVENAWSKTVEDFEEAKRTGEAWLWREETLRLRFFQHLLEQDINIIRILAETPLHIGEKDYHPDLLIGFLTDDVVNTAVFEFKYFGSKWEDDWEKLQEYGVIGSRWKYGYFLAIGRPWQSDKIPKEAQKREVLEHIYEVRGLTHSTPALKYAPGFKIAEDLLKASLKGVPYAIAEGLGAIALFKDILIYYDMYAKKGKCVVWAIIPKEIGGERRLRDIGCDKWISFDNEGRIQSSKSFTGRVLIGEFEDKTSPKNRMAVKDSLDQFKKKIESIS